MLLGFFVRPGPDGCGEVALICIVIVTTTKILDASHLLWALEVPPMAVPLLRACI
jgi:hypothetical protein